MIPTSKKQHICDPYSMLLPNELQTKHDFLIPIWVSIDQNRINSSCFKVNWKYLHFMQIGFKFLNFHQICCIQLNIWANGLIALNHVLKVPTMVMANSLQNVHLCPRYTSYGTVPTVSDPSVQVPGVETFPTLEKWHKALNETSNQNA